MSLYAIIIAGGRGKRFWPQSRINKPKYLLRLPKQKRTLLQDVAARMEPLVPNKNIIVVTNKLQYRDVARQLPQVDKKNIIQEPMMKNSAAAVGLAATIIAKRKQDAVLIVVPADQLIPVKHKNKFINVLKTAASFAKSKDVIVTIGIKPTYPATGFGYIKAGEKIKSNIFKADEFAEKPNLKKAKVFVKNKKYLWNSGIFVMKASVILKEMQKYLPVTAKGLKSIKGKTDLAKAYKKFPDISIDYAIVEKSKKVYVIKADIKWYDIGSWKNLNEVIKTDKKGNIVIGPCAGVDTKYSIIISERNHFIGAVGLKDIIIIHTDNATLVCDKKKAENVKGLVDEMEKRGFRKFL